MPSTTPTLHHRGSISGLSCLPLHLLKLNVINNFHFFPTTLSWMHDGLVIHLAIVHSIVIRRKMVVARSSGFSGIVVAWSGGFRGVCFSPIKLVIFGRLCRVWDGCVEAEKDWWRASRIPGQMDRSVFLHSTVKELAEQQPVGRWVELKQESVSPSSD